MASDVVMPRLGWTMEVGRVVEWLKRDGETVAAGEPIFSVESDKSVTEVEALDSGVLRIPPADQVGVELPVGATLAFITAPGEPAPFDRAGTAAPPVAPNVPADPVGGVARLPISTINEGRQSSVAAHGNGAPGRPTATGAGSSSRPASSPRARKLARDLRVDLATVVGGGVTGRIRERDVRAAAASHRAPEPRAAPTVRRLAEERGIRLDAVRPSGPVGRAVRNDVALASSPPSSRDDARFRAPEVSAGVAALPPMAISGARRVVFERMTEAARTVAPVTLHHPADATELALLRDRLRTDIGDDGPVPTYGDLFIRLAALTLRRHPALNASLVDGAIVIHAHVSIAFAVDAGEALLAPVVHDADRKSVHAIAAETAALISAIRGGTVAPDVSGGATFTISNLGMHGIDAFTPIVAPPQVAILGIGAIRPTPVVVDEAAGTVAVRRMLTLSLSFDHRIVDGAPAARFLHGLAVAIERPLRWLTM